MIDFNQVVAIGRPSGNVVDISSGGVSLWGGFKKINYVSFGDSIAVGHRIDENWLTDYGWDAQYGVDGRQQTTLVPGCYTDIIRQELESIYGKNRVSVTSFARSGDTVSDLMNKLTHSRVIRAVKNADLVTICILANDVLDHALANIEDYIVTADISKVDSLVENSLNILNDDSHPQSFISLMKKFNSINPNAKYVFTTIYNPYKHLHLVEGSQRGSFFFHVLNNIPRMLIDVDRNVEYLMRNNGLSWLLRDDDLKIYNVSELRWVSLELDIELGQYIKNNLLNTPAIKTLFKAVNAMGNHAEGYIAGNDRFIGLNPILKSKVASYQSTNPNFTVADTKKLFDLFPTRTDEDTDVDYSDLVNVDFSASYEITEMDWMALWYPEYNTMADYLTVLANRYLTFKYPTSLGDISTDPWKYVEFDLEGFAAELVDEVVTKVIEPHMDPHPRHHGHQVLKRSFGNMFGLTKYESNGGLYVPGDVVLYGGKLVAPNAIWPEHEFSGWYTNKALSLPLDTNRTDFVDYDSDITLDDLVSGNTVISKLPKVTQLYAKWDESNIVVLKNLVPSMDSLSFEVRSTSGTCEMSTAHAKYGSTALCNTGVDGYSEMYAMTTTKFKLIPSHTYYACVEVYQEEKLGTIDFFFPSGSPSMFGGKVTGDVGTWKKWSNVTTRSTFAEGEYPIRLDFNNGGTAGKVWYDGLMLIDLTEAFGAGNEPTPAWCEANIGYFVGTTTLYTPVEYIQSDGTQYIDTGFMPNNNTRIVIDIEHFDGDATSVAFYGCRDNKTATSSTKSFVGWQRSGGTSFNFHYGQSANIVQSPTGTNKGRFLIDHNKAVVTINGTKFNLKGASDFQADDSMFLLAAQTAGELDTQTGSHRLYSCQIYDNEVLVRDFIPCKHLNGTVGLYDKVNDVFYTNAGSGEFTTA